MKPLHTWNKKNDYASKTIKLYKSKVVVIQHFKNSDVEKIFTFNVSTFFLHETV